MLHSGRIVDLGAHPSLFNQSEIQPTCFPHNSNQGFRRDYVFASAELLPFVSSFRVFHDVVIPVHSTLEFKLTFTGQAPCKQILKTPTPLYGQFVQYVRETHNIGDTDATQVPHDIWTTELQALHRQLDSVFVEHAQALQDLCDSSDTTRLWALISDLLAFAFHDFFNKNQFAVHHKDFSLYGKP
eukprot:10985301-Karenia_brevis.AAC.1